MRKGKETLHTNDMEQKRARHRRFWEPLTRGEGAYLAVTSPLHGSGSPETFPKPQSVEERWLSVDYRLRAADFRARTVFWGQDAAQSEFVNFGPGVHAALLGAPYQLTERSVWFDLEPPIKDWDRDYAFHTDPGHPLYRAIVEHTQALCANAKGRYAVTYTDIGGQMDVLFSLRGEDLLMDLIEAPEAVLAAQEKLDAEFLSFFNTLTGLIQPTGCGFTNWIPLLSDVPWYPLQCDLSVMISPAMFERFVMPSLDKVARAIGRAVYHLDGPGEIQHIDMLLSLPQVHAIQWVPLPSAVLPGVEGRCQDFADPMSLDLYRRVLAAGKKMVLLGVQAQQIPAIFDAVGCDGIYVQTHCATRQDADDLLERARRDWLKL